ncbi:hypothetical protein FRC12_013831 [Ceratobasidium sp. 428]|nr:hypothetical protein FRC12_013831 [Ceratobasidium sp. 428]
MPRIFDIKTRKNIVPSGTNSPCGICRRQFAKYTCPACNLQYCSLTCYRSESHSGCTETFYKTALAEQIQGEPTRSNQEKQQMLELLKRFEEEAAEDEDEEGDINNIASRLQGVDLDSADHNALWERLTEEEKHKFHEIMANPTSEELKRLLETSELVEKPWWDSETASEGKAPVIQHVPQNMLESTRFNPMLLYNVFHVSLSYAYTIRTLGVSTLGPVGEQSPKAREEVEELKNVLLPLSPFLMDRKSTVTFTSVDSVITDWTSLLPQASPLYRPFIRLLLADSKILFRARSIFDATENSQSSAHDSCMRFLSDILGLLDTPKKHTHISLKLMFYLALIAKLPNQASMDLINAIQMWEAKTLVDEEPTESPVRKKVLVEELIEE